MVLYFFVIHAVVICFLIISCLLQIKFEIEPSDTKSIKALRHSRSNSDISFNSNYLQKTESRMLQLQEYHLINQVYTLSIPYFCQIYHLLNLKHLESVHSFSLNRLKILDVTQVEVTEIGGVVKFKTVLNSTFNLLRIWRQPIVEVALTLHTPYTIELCIPIYRNKVITVIFNVLPLSFNQHKLFIDIYSNLSFPKPIFQAILHFACYLTLFEDLPYLQQLADKNMFRLMESGQASKNKTMLLFKRFVDLYGSSLESLQLSKFDTLLGTT